MNDVENCCGFCGLCAIALYVIGKGGDSLDMSGEKHGADAVHSEPAKADASAPAADASAAK